MPWSLRSDAYGRSDVGTTFRGGRSMRSASCRAVAVVALSDAYRRSDVGTTIRGGGRSDAVGILSSGCRGSV